MFNSISVSSVLASCCRVSSWVWGFVDRALYMNRFFVCSRWFSVCGLVGVLGFFASCIFLYVSSLCRVCVMIWSGQLGLASMVEVVSSSVV